MSASYRQIEVERAGDVFCVRLRKQYRDEIGLQELGQELTGVVNQEGCRKLALSLGPDTPECLFSVFLAKLVVLQRVLHSHGGALKLCELNEHTLGVFEACRLKDHFHFAPDLPTAVAAFAE